MIFLTYKWTQGGLRVAGWPFKIFFFGGGGGGGGGDKIKH